MSTRNNEKKKQSKTTKPSESSDESLEEIFKQLRKTPDGQKLSERTFIGVKDLVKKMIRLHEGENIPFKELANHIEKLDLYEEEDDRAKGIEYETMPSGYVHIVKYEGFQIAGDKHAYKCKKCGAIFQSKSKEERTIFPTDDPRCIPCDVAGHTQDDIELVCKCKPMIFGY